MSWPQRREPSRAGAQTLTCPAHALSPTAALSRENLPSSREPSLVTSWLVRFLCLSLCTGLIRPSHNFLMMQLPPPSDWEFLWGWGQGTKPCSQLGPSTGSGPEEVLREGLSDGWVSSWVGAWGPSPQMSGEQRQMWGVVSYLTPCSPAPLEAN